MNIFLKVSKALKILLFVAGLSVLFLTANNVHACTNVSGNIIGETWTKANSPYCVVGDIIVIDLVIESGVTVEFDGNYVFEVQGLLSAVGLDNDPIVFTRAATNTVGWQGIFFNFTLPGAELAYCTIEGSINSGVRIDNSEPLIRSCTIRDNTSPGHGGGMSADLSAAQTLTVQDSILENNTANPSNANVGNYVGGALYLAEGNAIIRNNQFIGNTSNSKCTAIECGVTARGGAIYIGGSGKLMINNNEIRDNNVAALNTNRVCLIAFTRSYGGGIYVNSGEVTLKNNILEGNSTTVSAGGPNCGLFHSGSGLYVNGGSVDVVNSTIASNDNSAGVHLAGGTLGILNSIIFFNNNNGSQIVGAPTITYSDVQGGYPGDGNIDIQPLLVDDENCPYLKIASVSPCVDAGNPDVQYQDVCFGPSHGSAINDMGAHGGPGACNWCGDVMMDTDGDGLADSMDNCIFAANGPLIPDAGGNIQLDTDADGYGNLCDGDLNNDGSTNTLDLNLYKLAHRSSVGDTNYNADADFNGDGEINTLDLNIYKGLHRKPPGPSCCGLF